MVSGPYKTRTSSDWIRDTNKVRMSSQHNYKPTFETANAKNVNDSQVKQDTNDEEEPDTDSVALETTKQTTKNEANN